MKDEAERAHFPTQRGTTKRAALAIALLLVSYAVVSTPTPMPRPKGKAKPTPTPRQLTAYERMLQKETTDHWAFSVCYKRAEKLAADLAEKLRDVCSRMSPNDALRSFALCHAIPDSSACNEELATLKADQFWLTSNDPPAGIAPFDIQTHIHDWYAPTPTTGNR